MKTLALLLMAVLPWGSLSAQNLDTVFEDYIELKNHLIEGNQNSAKSSSVQLLKSLENLKAGSDQKALINEIMASTKKISEANTIEQQRNELGKQSEPLWKLIRVNKSFQNKAYYNYCPMKKSFWVSEDKNIKNPFYGKQMLQCGKVEESIN